MFNKSVIAISLGLLYALLTLYFVWQDQAYFSLSSLGLLAIFFAVYYTEWTFLGIAFLAPISINIEEYTQSFGLFLPTEPMLFGLMLLLTFQQLKSKILPKDIWRNPIIWAVGFYLFWIIITSITSTHVLASFKFLLARLWFIVPMLLFGTIVFAKLKNIKAFIWLYCIGMMIAMAYTLIIHAGYGFGEKEGHWVMWPFFKDHTIYGCMVAFIVPLVIGLYFSKKHTLLIQVILLSFIVLTFIALFFSYTRAAWLSIFAAVGVWGLIHFKIKFSLIVSIVGFIGITLFFSWDAIQIEMARNKSEHTTEEFGERLQSATNVTTDASNLERLNRWSCAIAMFSERPVFGFGPGTYAFEYARFQEPENLTIISTNFGNAGNAHSEYLGPMAEMGILGLVSVLLIVATIFYKGIMLYNNWPIEDNEIRILILSMILALVTYFIHAVLNNFLDTDKAAVPIWGFSACFIALEIQLKKKNLTFK
ncbi:MAG: O-antigen ligase family protein [Flavobacteriia bacterium]|nr:O-antigen ligase family protein [Flavobacteriia bacterium]